MTVTDQNRSWPFRLRKRLSPPVRPHSEPPGSRRAERDYTSSLMNLRPGAEPCFHQPNGTRRPAADQPDDGTAPIPVRRFCRSRLGAIWSWSPCTTPTVDLDLDRIQAFVVPSDIGISYNADVWHHLMTVLDSPAIFATVMFNDGGPDDEEFVELSADLVIDLPDRQNAHGRLARIGDR